MKLKYFDLRVAAVVAAVAVCMSSRADSIPDAAARGPLVWRAGIELSPAFVPGTNRFLRGENAAGKSVNASFAGALRADFSFNPRSRTGRLYPGLYQGIGVGVHAFDGGILGTPVSAFVYQGAPFARFGTRMWLDYEWQFGAAFGWKHHSGDVDDDNAVVSTAVTARMGLGLKLHYRLSDRLTLSAGINATHFSNGNTSFPNAGVNTVGATVGVAYALGAAEDNAMQQPAADATADAGKWFLDVTAYGAWRKRGIIVHDDGMMCPGKFGVAGVQVAPMRKFNRLLSAGVSLDLQYDESAGLEPYWVEGSWGEDVKFYRPPFGKQLSAGLSAHAELTMPIFAINAGLGYDFVCPRGDKRFYQSLALKTFVTQRIYLNVGYRLRRFKDPQNLMLGVGVRI